MGPGDSTGRLLIATYPIAVVDGSRDSALAYQFVRFVLGRELRVLSRFGFLPA